MISVMPVPLLVAHPQGCSPRSHIRYIYALAAGLVWRFYIDRLDKLSEGIGRQLLERAVSLYPLNKLLDILCLPLLFMELPLQTLDLSFKVFLFLNLRRFFINHPVFGVVRGTLVTIGDVGGQAFVTLTLCLADGTDFAAGILCKKLVKPSS